MPSDYPLEPIQLIKARQGIPANKALYADLTFLLGEDPLEVAQRENLHGIYREVDESRLLGEYASYCQEPKNKDHKPLPVDVMFVSIGMRVIVHVTGPLCDHTCPACKLEIDRGKAAHEAADPLEQICRYLASLEDLLAANGVDVSRLPPIPSAHDIAHWNGLGSLGNGG